MTSVKRRANNVEKDIFDYVDNFAFLFSTATATTENIDKAEISSNYIVTPAIDTETWTVDEEMGIRTIYDTIRQGETNLHEKKCK